MAIPGNWSTVNLTGRYIGSDGEPQQGKVEFRVYPDTRIKIISEQVIFIPDLIVAPLDSEGRFQVTIPSSNDPDITPHFQWYVRERFLPNLRFNYLIDIPYDVSELDISDLVHHPVGVKFG